MRMLLGLAILLCFVGTALHSFARTQSDPVSQAHGGVLADPGGVRPEPADALTAAWTSATTQDAALTAALANRSTVIITFRVSDGEITAGAIAFEESRDNSSWFPAFAVRTEAAHGERLYNLTEENQEWTLSIPAGSHFRVRLAHVIEGSGMANVGISMQTLGSANGAAIPMAKSPDAAESEAADSDSAIPDPHSGTWPPGKIVASENYRISNSTTSAGSAGPDANVRATNKPAKMEATQARSVTSGAPAESTAAWTSATLPNAALTVATSGFSSESVFLNQGSTLTGGAVAFEVSDTSEFVNAYPVECAQASSATSGTTYSFTASTNQAFRCDVSGFTAFRVRLSGAIGGTATVNVGVLPTMPSPRARVAAGAILPGSPPETKSSLPCPAADCPGNVSQSELASAASRTPTVRNGIERNPISSDSQPGVVRNAGVLGRADVATAADIVIPSVPRRETIGAADAHANVSPPEPTPNHPKEALAAQAGPSRSAASDPEPIRPRARQEPGELSLRDKSAAAEHVAASAPRVTYAGGMLTISAQNSLLSDIMSALHAAMGADIDLPAGASGQRIWVQAGPGPARKVLDELLSSTDLNYVIQGSATDADGIRKVLLSAHGDPTSGAPRSPGGPSNQAASRRDSPIDSETQEATELTNSAVSEPPTAAGMSPPNPDSSSPALPNGPANPLPAVAESVAHPGPPAALTQERITQQLLTMYEQRKQLQQNQQVPPNSH